MKSKETETSKKSIRKKLAPVMILTLLAVTALLVWWFMLRRPAVPQDILSVSGRIESDDAAVAAKTSGRIREIRVREGDLVKAGQVIAVLDDAQIRAQVSQAQSTVNQAEARVQRARQQIAVLQSQLDQGRLSLGQSRADAEGRVSQARAQVAAAEAMLAQAQAQYQQAMYDREKFSILAEQGDVSERTGKQAINTAEAQKAIVDAARKQVDAARGALIATQAALDNPAIRASQVSATQQQILQAQSDIQSAEAEAANARAQLQEAIADQNDLEVVAPFDGTVATRAVEPGEVVSPGKPIVTLTDLTQIYLRAFIPEGEIGKVRLGQPARIYLDSNPQHSLDATVARIDSQASFTPENTYFRDDRVKQVVGVKLTLVNPQGYAKPGMPADGEVLIQGEKWLTASRTR